MVETVISFGDTTVSIPSEGGEAAAVHQRDAAAGAAALGQQRSEDVRLVVVRDRHHGLA
jgi:hypothetical protein